jgi:hypothetical protein
MRPIGYDRYILDTWSTLGLVVRSLGEDRWILGVAV